MTPLRHFRGMAGSPQAAYGGAVVEPKPTLRSPFVNAAPRTATG